MSAEILSDGYLNAHNTDEVLPFPPVDEETLTYRRMLLADIYAEYGYPQSSTSTEVAVPSLDNPTLKMRPERLEPANDWEELPASVNAELQFLNANSPQRILDILAVTVGGDPTADSDENWQARSLCAQTDPEVFFPEKGGSTRAAKKICAQCDVKAPCLEDALVKDERFGVRGGLSERERRRLKGKTR